jgi:hypothetical protein
MMPCVATLEVSIDLSRTLRQQATAARGTAPAARWLGFLQHVLEK